MRLHTTLASAFGVSITVSVDHSYGLQRQTGTAVAPLASLAAVAPAMLEWGGEYYKLDLKDDDGSFVALFVEHGADYAGSCEMDGGAGSAELSKTQASSLAECSEMCRREPKCNWVVYSSRDGSCQMLYAAVSFGATNDGETNRPKFCDSTCYLKNRGYDGEAYRTLNGVHHPYECHYNCWMDAYCKRWSFSNSGQCQLFTAGGNDKPVNVKNSWAGTRRGCGDDAEIEAKSYEGATHKDDYAGNCAVPNWTGLAHNYEITVTDTLDQCAKLCLDDSRCQWITWNQNTRRCHKKAKRGDVGPPRIKGDFTSPKICNSSCYQKDRGYKGDLTGYFSSVQTPYECQYFCSGHEPCKFWSYNPESRRCESFGADVGGKDVDASGIWSGRKRWCGSASEYPVSVW